jgi:hypothetical protein
VNAQVSVIRVQAAQALVPSSAVPQPVAIAVEGAIAELEGVTEATEATAAATPESQQAEQQKAQRLQQIQQLTFDRRPSTILKVWSEQANKAKEPETKAEASDNASAAPADDASAQATGDAKPESSDTPNETADATSEEQAPASADAASTEAASADTASTEATSTDAAKEAATEAAAKAQQAAKEAAEKASAAQKAAAEAAEKFRKQLEALQTDVTLGRWVEVQQQLKDRDAYSEDEAKALYQRLVTQLASQAPLDFSNVPGMSEQQLAILQNFAMNAQGRAGAQLAENHVITFDDLGGIIKASPVELERETVGQLAQLLRLSLSSGNSIDLFLQTLRTEGESLLTPRRAAWLLSAAGQDDKLGEFLPPVDKAIAENDREALNLLARQRLAEHAVQQKDALLEDAWKVTLAALAAGDIDAEQKQEALQRAVSLATRIRDELGQAWLNESFTERPERGQEILATIGSATAQRLAQSPHDAQGRLQNLKLQAAAVESLVSSAPERASQWHDSLNLLAFNWLQEAEVSRQFSQETSYGPSLRRDMYGNIFYSDPDDPYGQPMNYNRNQPAPIAVRDILETMPKGTWLELVDPALQPQFAKVTCQLLLKVSEDADAFPYIERLAETYPSSAKELAEEFLRVWTRNHNPNDQRQRTNYYMFMYGFESRAERIPLTRSKQERNLTELSKWVERLRKLPIGELDEKLLVSAFTTCHSAAEVYQLDAIEEVFGAWDGINPGTLAELVQTMRRNLAEVWREPAVQRQAGTNRKKADIAAEVKRGYQVANEILTKAIEDHPENWQLLLAQATVAFDQIAYDQETSPNSEFSARRNAAFELFRQAATAYGQKVTELSEEDQSTDVLDLWFYAALGATDLGRLDEKSSPDLKQIGFIRQTLDQLPGEAATRHRDRFANALFTRMSAVNPACKFRYLRGGFDIVGEHPQAREAKQVYEYYNDLVTEIELEVVLDSSNNVGHGEPFGVYVNLRHTKEIERESGGFGKYLQNQNNMYYSYNYGRPTENYRDKFQEAATKA